VVGRHKAVIGPKRRAHGLSALPGENAIAAEALNRMSRAVQPISIYGA
jgi:hypothetical protein